MKTDNELIAEFMDIPKIHGYDLWDTSKTGKPIYGLPSRDLRYHSSWDWLMPVVEKINNTSHPILKERLDVTIYCNTCHINDENEILIETTGRNMLECTYKAVVEFIKWYNQQEQ